MIVDSTNVLIKLREMLSTVSSQFTEDRNKVDLLLNKYADLAVRSVNGEDVSERLNTVKKALDSFRADESDTALDLARYLTIDVFVDILVKTL